LDTSEPGCGEAGATGAENGNALCVEAGHLGVRNSDWGLRIELADFEGG
jgi:hypothetical protein